MNKAIKRIVKNWGAVDECCDALILEIIYLFVHSAIFTETDSLRSHVSTSRSKTEKPEKGLNLEKAFLA